MNIGTVIKKLRRERGMTQEELAESIGVSVSAVSQWESEKTAPDISLVPSLCNLFDVSADVLFEIDKAKNEEQIKKIRDEANKFYSRGYNEEGRKILEAGLRKFPKSYELMRDLMYVFSFQADACGDKKQKEECTEKAISFGEKILAECTDDSIRHSAIQILCYGYHDKGETEKAKNLAEKMPRMFFSHEALMVAACEGTEKHKALLLETSNIIQTLSNNIGYTHRKLDDGTFVYNAEERAALRDKRIAFLELMFENGDFGFYHCHLDSTHSLQARYYAGRKNAEKALYHLERAAYHAIEFLNGCNSELLKEKNSLLFKGDTGFSSWSTSNKSNNASFMLDTMKCKEFDFICEDEKFLEIKKKLTAYAGDWKTE